MIEAYEGMCQLINKTGACWQCRGLRELASESNQGLDLVPIELRPKVSVSSILTSLYPTTHGIKERTDRLPASATTLAKIYRQAGYATLSFSSTPWTGKVLASRRSADPELRQRFEREARAVSSLNHPHICTLHDIGSHDGVDYLVMEYLDGESLADRLKKGALPLDEALRYGREIADGLDEAHRKGIVHRDMKPGNVMLTPRGAKLLDFGLATRLRQGFGAPRASEKSEIPTHNQPLTREGAILGTFQYSPCDKRSARLSPETSSIARKGTPSTRSSP